VQTLINGEALKLINWDSATNVREVLDAIRSIGLLRRERFASISFMSLAGSEEPYSRFASLFSDFICFTILRTVRTTLPLMRIRHWTTI
jgi:hypothetical protein